MLAVAQSFIESTCISHGYKWIPAFAGMTVRCYGARLNRQTCRSQLRHLMQAARIATCYAYASTALILQGTQRAARQASASIRDMAGDAGHGLDRGDAGAVAKHGRRRHLRRRGRLPGSPGRRYQTPAGTGRSDRALQLLRTAQSHTAARFRHGGLSGTGRARLAAGIHSSQRRHACIATSQRRSSWPAAPELTRYAWTLAGHRAVPAMRTNNAAGSVCDASRAAIARGPP